MNNYLTTEADEDITRKEELQQRHYQLLNELQSLASELPINYQQRLPYELLSNLASCLLDDSIPEIVNGLKDIQHITEKTLYEKRVKNIENFKASKAELLKKHREAAAAGKLNYEQIASAEKEFDKYIEDETNKLDMKLVMQLDQVVSEQQVTLEKAGVPGFSVTNNPNEIRLQMYILEFIRRLSDRSTS